MIIRSQTTVSNCLRDVLDAINDELLREKVYFPITPEERYWALNKFQTAKRPMPGAIASADGTPIYMKSPQNDEFAFVGHHKHHAMNAMLVNNFFSQISS